MSQTVRILVCFATREEARPLRPLARVLGDVTIVVTGMGRQNAEKALSAALAAAPVDWVLSCGFAGGLDPALELGTVVFGGAEDPALIAELQHLGAKAVRFHCADRVAVSAGEKAALRQSSSADAVEMESEAIQKVCRAKKIPCAILRVISDTADEDLPLDFNRLLTAEKNLHPGKLALALIRSPGKIPRLWKFGRQVKDAGRRLATVIASVILALRAPAP